MADNAELKKITGAVEDAVTYPILTRETGSYGAGGGGRSGGDPTAGAGTLTRTAQNAIRDLLGWRYRSTDSKGFLAALNKSVELKTVEGRVESKWTARPFMVQADMGEVTGAQASLYARAKAALDHALPLLDGLKPNRADSNEEQLNSIRAIVRSAWVELVNELGVVSGPRIQRVDDYFRQLIGVSSPQDPAFQRVTSKPELVQGNLGRLAKRFGFNRHSVLTVEGEQNFTNFLILVDHTTSLFQTWSAQKSFLTRSSSGDRYLGTQLVRLSEQFAVIVEGVQEVYDAMDSVFFGPEERQVAELRFDTVLNDVGPITVAELLSWTEHFATVEARQLIEDSGRDGILTVAETLERLCDMYNATAGFMQTQASSVPRALNSLRVRESFHALAKHITNTHQSAASLDSLKVSTPKLAPEVKNKRVFEALVPNSVRASRAAGTRFTLLGRNLEPLITSGERIEFVRQQNGPVSDTKIPCAIRPNWKAASAKAQGNEALEFSINFGKPVPGVYEVRIVTPQGESHMPGLTLLLEDDSFPPQPKCQPIVHVQAPPPTPPSKPATDTGTPNDPPVPAKAQPPQITEQPASGRVPLGARHILSVRHEPDPTCRIQWLLNSFALPHGTTPELVIEHMDPSHEGTYVAILTNPSGFAVSHTAKLDLEPPALSALAAKSKATAK